MIGRLAYNMPDKCVGICCQAADHLGIRSSGQMYMDSSTHTLTSLYDCRCVVIEDSHIGVTAAKAAGMR